MWKMVAVQSAELSTAARPIKTTSLPGDAYVLSLASAQAYYAASSSAPSNTIYLYDKSNLRPISQMAAHDEAITTMRAVPNFAGVSRETLVSSGKDGLVKVWDERTGSVAVQNVYVR